jgi:peroxiredoxin (alkyl hydroperoxide reductase subunit C)
MYSFFNLFKPVHSKENQELKAGSRNFRVPLIGEYALPFTAESTSGTINFPLDFGEYWKIIFSHPMDFTPVCSTELLELSKLQAEFEKHTVKIIIVSTDPLETHLQWKKTLEHIEYKAYTKNEINFPLVDDSGLVIAKKYGMIHPESDNNRDVRGVFIIDTDNKIRAEFFYPQEIGRNMNEILRTVIALQTADKNRVMTPANWNIGNDVLTPFPLKGKMPVKNKEDDEYYQVAWFLIFKKSFRNISKERNTAD